MPRFPRCLLPLLLSAAVPCYGTGLPDTGQDSCYSDTGTDRVAASNAGSIARDAGTHPRQDCRYGRDAAAAVGALTKTGAGAKGFDYTKIANNGTTLPAGAALGNTNTAWGCTRDNITGLTWEVKTASSTDLRYSGHTYTWFSSDFSTDGGDHGSAGANTCNATLPLSQCNTEAFVAAVNAAALCTYINWRLPTQRELLTLVYADGSSPSIAPTYFPNTPALLFWSGTTFVQTITSAWYVDFSVGNTFPSAKTNNNYLRLVRGGQF